MAAGHSWSTAFRFFLYLLLFIPLRQLLETSRLLRSLLFGEPRLERLVGGQPERLVEVRRILWRFQIRESLGNVLESCLHAHARYESAQAFVWSDPRVHLYNLTDEGAVFVRTTVGVDVYNSDVAAFAFHSLLQHAQEFAIIPYDVFEKLATEKLNKLNSDPENKRTKKVILIASPARCGSTLMLQHFEDVPGCVAICEPQALLDMTFDPSRSALFQSIFIFILKPLFVRSSVDILAIKLCIELPWMIKDVADRRDSFPFTPRFLFTHRRPIPAFNSWLRLNTEFLCDAFAFGSQLPLIGRLFSDVAGEGAASAFPPWMLSGFKRLVDDADRWARRFAWMEALDFREMDKEFLTTRWGKPASVGRSSLTAHFFCFYLVGALTLIELKRRPEYAEDILAVAYEELTTAPRIWQEKIIPFCGLAPCETKALRRDSQRQSPYQRRRLETHATKLSVEDVVKLDEVVKATGISETLNEFELVL